MRLTIKALLLAVALVLVTGLAAKADPVTQFEWDRTGAELLPCASDALWVLSPGEGIDNATIGINDDDGEADGHAWGMLKNWDDLTWYITTTEPIATTDEVLVAYLGTAEVAPTLTLTGCVGAETPPTGGGGGGGSTEPPAPAPPTQTISWDIGFQIATGHLTNVVAKYRLTCSNGTDTLIVKGRVKGKTPLVRSLNPTLADATSCHLRVVAKDVRPWVNLHHAQRPIVTTWVTQN